MKKSMFLVTMLCALLLACKPDIEKPTVVTKSVGNVTETSAKVVGQVSADGGAEVTERGVCWNTEGTPEIIDFRAKEGSGVGSFTSELNDLEPNTTYYVRAYAVNEAGTSYGDEVSFTTLEEIPEQPEEPEQPEDPEEPEQPEDPEEPEQPEDPEEPEQPEDPEEPEQPEDPEEPEQPEDPEEPEQPVAPVVVTSDVTEITAITAVCGGEVIDGGGAVVVARGVCWSTSQNPTTEDNKTIDGAGTGVFTSNLVNLTDNTTYYVRAYATNKMGTSYGDEKIFTTLEKQLPVISTAEVEDITTLSAVSGGNVIFDGNVAVTARGVCWSTSQNPTTEDNKTIDGAGTGVFTSNLINLTDNTKYYVRAYATNEMGTSYGDEKVFTTLSATGRINGYEYVDLGLPSGLKWATCNVGANNPEDYGNYYAWGETETKSTYTEDNSQTYLFGISDLFMLGIIDDDGYFTSSYDAATSNWGGSWRMPTYDEQGELLNNCEWEWTTRNGVNGYEVTGPNGNSIFLPAAGGRDGSSLYGAGEYGRYWSSTPYNSMSYSGRYYAYYFGFGSDHPIAYNCDRYNGFTIRPVSE